MLCASTMNRDAKEPKETTTFKLKSSAGSLDFKGRMLHASRRLCRERSGAPGTNPMDHELECEPDPLPKTPPCTHTPPAAV